MNDIHKIRRDNIQALVLSRFKGNKAAFSRMTKTHENHINLVLSVNDKISRKLGENLARRIEENLGLKYLWLDSVHTAEDPDSVVAIPIDAKLSHILRESPVKAIRATGHWFAGLAAEATGIQHLFLGAIATSELEPTLCPGDIVIVDREVKAYVNEGIYLISVGGDTLLRKIRKPIMGGYVMQTGKSEDRLESLTGIEVLGRILRKVQLSGF